MHPSEAAQWFDEVRLDGWNGSWVEDISSGDFHAYDRFISERDFGALKRIFLAPRSSTFDPFTYPVVRTKDGVVRIVESVNGDYAHDIKSYQESFLLLEASDGAQVYSKGTTARASGVSGSEVPALESSTWAQISRYSGKAAEEFTDSRNSTFEVTIPHGVAMHKDWFIVSGGYRYEAQEVYTNLLTTVVTARRLPNG